MLVREIMHADPVAVGAGTTLDAAYALMQEKGIRHLPVLDGERLVGVITDRDLRLATSRLSPRPFASSSAVREIMSCPVHFAQPLDPVETAARTMRELKIGCLPVIDDDRLVGIVTGIDMLDAFLVLSGVHRPSSRLELRLPDRPGELARLTSLLAEKKVNIHSILSYAEGERGGRIVLRLGTMESRTLARDLCDAGFEVLWPTDTQCRG